MIKVMAFLIVNIIGIFLSPLVIAPCYNSLKLHKLKRDFQELSHPAGTHILATRSDVGLLSGNGNHCDFFVGSLLEVPAETNVEAFYAKQRITIPFTDMSISPDIDSFVEPAYSGLHRAEIPTPVYHLSQFSQRGIEKPPSLEHVYLVSVFLNHPANADIRCH